MSCLGALTAVAGGVLPYCAENNITFMPYGALGGHKAREGRRDLRGNFPGLVQMASQKGVSPHAVVLAWMRHKWPCILHIVGARQVGRLGVVHEAAQLSLTEQEIDRISGFKKPTGVQ